MSPGCQKGTLASEIKLSEGPLTGFSTGLSCTRDHCRLNHGNPAVLALQPCPVLPRGVGTQRWGALPYLQAQGAPEGGGSNPAISTPDQPLSLLHLGPETRTEVKSGAVLAQQTGSAATLPGSVSTHVPVYAYVGSSMFEEQSAMAQLYPARCEGEYLGVGELIRSKEQVSPQLRVALSLWRSPT